MNDASEDFSGNISHYLKQLEQRIQRIEQHLGLSGEIETEALDEPTASESQPVVEEDALEYRIGQFWMAKIGIVVLALGIVFLLTFPYKDVAPFLPSLFGYLIAGAIFVLARYLHDSFSYISRYLVGGGLVLFYFSTLRLYFFSAEPLLNNLTIEIALLLLVVAVNLIVSWRRQSVYLTAISLTLGYITVILSNQAIFTFLMIAILSTLTVYLKLKFRWDNLIFLGIILSYFTHLNWFMNNPLLGNELQLLSSPSWHAYFLLLYAVIFAAGNYFREKDKPEDDLLIANTVLNCLGCFVLYFFITLIKMKADLPVYHLIASVVFVAVAIAFWIKERSKYSTFAYSIIGFIALSVAIIDAFDIPDFFILLSWQSLLVISTAIWFRSKIIVVANFYIYLIVFIVYLLMAGKVSTISLSFGIVALLSARIMNWQKERLNLRTELMRNSYLASAFFIFPYTLYHLVPRAYLVLSWVGVALFYYLLSLLLKNKKYRWMALSTLLLTVLYIFIIGIISMEPVYRIISFLVLGVALLVISWLYGKTRMKKGHGEANEI